MCGGFSLRFLRFLTHRIGEISFDFLLMIEMKARMAELFSIIFLVSRKFFCLRNLVFKNKRLKYFQFQMLRVTLFYLLAFSVFTVFGFLEESEGVIPKDRTCDPEEERAAQSCKNVSSRLSE